MRLHRDCRSIHQYLQELLGEVTENDCLSVEDDRPFLVEALGEDDQRMRVGKNIAESAFLVTFVDFIKDVDDL